MAGLHRTRPTIRDVARHAQVSHQTVSRVINGEAYTAAATRARVERAIAQLGFRPSHIARSLVSRRTHTIGLVMGDVASPFFPDVVRGIEDVLAPAGYSLILSSSRRDPARELANVRHLVERSTDGLILGAPQADLGELTGLAARSGVPMVFLNRDVVGRQVASVWVDGPAAAQEVVAYLARLGHRRIALVAASRQADREGNREAWYRRALARAGLALPPAWILREAITLEGGQHAGQRLLALAERPTAAICHSDVMAIGVLQVCRAGGVRVPRELSLVGWDDVPYASAVEPSLTTVRVPRYEFGQAAARRLLALLAGAAPSVEPPLRLELIERDSCGPSRQDSATRLAGTGRSRARGARA